MLFAQDIGALLDQIKVIHFREYVFELAAVKMNLLLVIDVEEKD